MTIHQLCVEKVIILSWRTESVIWVLVFKYYWKLWPTLGLPQDVQVCQGQDLPWPEIFDNSSSPNDQEQSVLSTTKNCQPTRIGKTDLSHLEPIEGLEGANRIWETARKLKPRESVTDWTVWMFAPASPALMILSTLTRRGQHRPGRQGSRTWCDKSRWPNRI